MSSLKSEGLTEDVFRNGFDKINSNIKKIKTALFCISLIAAVQNYKIDLFEIAGPGFFISLFASVISVFAAWTNIGRNYNNGYKQYMKVVTYCQLISVVIYIIVEMIPERYYLEFPGTEIDFNPILAVMWVSLSV